MDQADDILERLELAPDNWNLRLEAIENAVRMGDSEEARRLVRESPGDAPTPDDVQVRLHSLLTLGATALPEESRPFPEVVPPDP